MVHGSWLLATRGRPALVACPGVGPCSFAKYNAKYFYGPWSYGHVLIVMWVLADNGRVRITTNPGQAGGDPPPFLYALQGRRPLRAGSAKRLRQLSAPVPPIAGGTDCNLVTTQ